MKAIQKTLSFLLAAALLCAGLLPVCASESEDFDYRIQDGGAIITHFSGTDVTVTLPDSLGGYPVVGMEVDAFQGSITLAHITLPDTVTALEAEQFSSCTALETIQLGAGLRKIGVSAFWNCKRLRTITIPDSVTSIGYYAFSDCAALETVYLGSGVTEIPNGVFEMCRSLRSVYFGENVRTVHADAFFGCFHTDGDVYIFDRLTSFSDRAMDHFAGTVHCFRDSVIDRYARNAGWDVTHFTLQKLETALDAPLSVAAAAVSQAVPTDGLHVFGIYVDESNADAVIPRREITDYTVEKTMVFDQSGDARIPVQYDGFTAYYSVTVLDPVTETGIVIVSVPGNTVYYASALPQTIDLDGLQVDLLSSDGTRTDVTDRCTVAGTALLNTPGTAQISVQFGAYSASFPVEVRQAALHLTVNGAPVSGTVLKKIGLFSAYRKNPVMFGAGGIEESLIRSVRWEIAQGSGMRVDENGTLRYTNFFAGTGVVRVTVTDIHGAVQTAEARVIFYRLRLQLPLRFSRYL